MLKALKGGFEETDGFNSGGKAGMSTSQTWQAIVWSLLYPGELYVLVNAVNVNEGGVTVAYYLRTRHEPLKGKIDVNKLGKEGLLALTFGMVLGDGTADIMRVVKGSRIYDEAIIVITMSDEEFERWRQLFERLRSMGFKSGKPNMNNKTNVVYVRFNSGNAIDLARAMISVLPPILRDVLDALSFDKWVNLRRISEVEVKFRIGESQIEVTGYKFTVKVNDSTVVLAHCIKDETTRVIETLKTVYGDEFYAYIREDSKCPVVIIPMYVIERYDDIKGQVIQVLCKKLEKAKDERRRRIITRHLRRLAPTEGAAAAY